MQDPDIRQELDPIPDEETFRKALLAIERFGAQTHEIARRQQELLAIEKDRAAKEADVLRKRAEEKDRQLEALRKTLIDAQMELSEARRSENSLSLEVKQLKEQVSVFRVDGERIEEAESQLRASRDENATLKTRLEEQSAEAAKAARDHKTELDALVLKYEQEKIQLGENVQVALEKVRNVADTIERYKSLAALAESEKNAAAEEMERSRAFVQHSVEAPNGDCEGTPVAISEAMMAGLPVVATRHAGIPDIISSGENGFLVDEYDVPQMAHWMLELARDPELARATGERARAFALEHLTAERNINLLFQVLEKAAQTRTQSRK